MNCAECRENLVTCLEGLLEGELAVECQAHIEGCGACRGEYAELAGLHERLLASGRAAEGVSVVAPVMRRVLQRKAEHERTSIMSILRTRWGIGLGAALGVAGAVVVILALTTPKALAKAEDVMNRGARAMAKLTSIHLRGQMRTLPADNFSMIGRSTTWSPSNSGRNSAPASSGGWTSPAGSRSWTAN